MPPAWSLAPSWCGSSSATAPTCSGSQKRCGNPCRAPLARQPLAPTSALSARARTHPRLPSAAAACLAACPFAAAAAAAAQWYSRDLFLFLFVCLTAVALGCSLQPVRTPLLLNRPQTEEWKGWMQVLFLLYHYFEAREAYNAIRIFIAGYVWMTGYGNFSYYYRSGDFSIGR